VVVPPRNATAGDDDDRDRTGRQQLADGIPDAARVVGETVETGEKGKDSSKLIPIPALR
jgi:hypothetical protein